MRTLRMLLVSGLATGVVGCSDTPTPTQVATSQEALAARGAVTPSQPAPSPTIVDVALAVNASTGEFSTLLAAVVAADLASALSARGQRTVFAPTDAAFATLGLNAGNIGTLPTDALTNILLYHVAAGRRDSGSVVGSDRIRMANGGFTRVSLEGGAAFINDARIVQPDVSASNGIIHVIDAVLLP